VNRELTKQTDSMHDEYRRFKAQGLKLNLTRGNPSSKQLDLCADLLALPLDTDYISEGRIDCRNYGGPQGIIEVRRLFSGIVGAPPEQVVVGNNSSLSLMHDIVTYSLLRGTCDGSLPWSKEKWRQVLVSCPWI
jgi:Aspartate amino-transferase